ncbi:MULTISPECIES: IclR family transcriptional regulator [Nocardioides]|uniref:IclR family transcriptional regulator n=1 Tax=Nocardioides oceani TaxID=3058369 RepID=A0ABT8FFN6_9ACTN|nr:MULTISPECIES: IclR family transcriptional regulator [Nocardioides]MDN4173350.1 IclR family transcriptional regulator [Nocardioides oceani]WKN48308.1 IclR family transcriptional regulator [Nocardioides sp. Arc9.136]
MGAGISGSVPRETPGGTEAADRVADVLLLFARSDDALGVSRIARSLELSKAVVHRILQSLASRSLVQPLPGGSAYVLGPAAAGLAARAWSQLDVRSVASPVLRRLRDQTRETTTLSVLVGNQRIYLDQIESPQEIKMVVEIGPRFPLHSGASSRAILAHLPESFVGEAVGQLQAARPDLDVEAYRADLARIREQGYAVSLNERGTGAASIAAPFFDSAGNVAGSVSSSGPVFRYAETDEEHTRLVVQAARDITARLSPS